MEWIPYFLDSDLDLFASLHWNLTIEARVVFGDHNLFVSHILSESDDCIGDLRLIIDFDIYLRTTA